VEEFGIGYPPRAAVLFERNGVKYTLNWLPLGGFVRFATNEGDQPESLYGAGGSLQAAPPWRKILVMVAGPLMNLFLTIIIFAGLFMTMGVPQPVAQQINEVYPNTPAASAGFQTGDVLISLNGQSTAGANAIGNIAQTNSGQPIEAVVQRGEEQISLTVTPGRWVTPDGDVVEAGFGFGYSAQVEYGWAN
jgi:regulator of sigma E protease